MAGMFRRSLRLGPRSCCGGPRAGGRRTLRCWLVSPGPRLTFGFPATHRRGPAVCWTGLGRHRGSRCRQGFAGGFLALTRSSPPAESGLSHWSSRQMATFIACTEGVPVSPSYVAALWRANGLTPQRQGTFSRDPQFADKVADIVGLYLDPPGARSCSAWTKRPSFRPYRTQPLLPISVGAAEKRTHDYVRHGTTNLFAALNVTSGDVYGECHPTRAGASFLAFLKHAVAPHARMSMSCWPICRRTPHPMSRPGWRPTRRFTSTSPRSAHPGSIRSRPGSAP